MQKSIGNIFKGAICSTLFFSLSVNGTSILEKNPNFCKLPEENILDLGKIQTEDQSWSQNTPTEAELDIFVSKISNLKSQSPTGINIILADQGSSRFIDSMPYSIFVDPAISGFAYKGKLECNEIMKHYEQFLFIRSTLSDFLYFLNNSEKLFSVLNKSAKIIFDDWNIIAKEMEYSYGESSTPVHVMDFNDKISCLSNLLTGNGKIIMGSQSLAEGRCRYISWRFDISIFSFNIRGVPNYIERSPKHTMDLWIFSPVEAFFEVFHEKQYKRNYFALMEEWGMTENDYKRLETLFISYPYINGGLDRMVELSLKDFYDYSEEDSKEYSENEIPIEIL